jgi:hypothetical protein
MEALARAFAKAVKHVDDFNVPGDIVEVGLGVPFNIATPGRKCWVYPKLSQGAFIPDRVAVCRLMGDWYTAKFYELECLWPRLHLGGILIVDCYGHMLGARRAVDEFFEIMGMKFEGVEIDYTAVMMVKPC